MTDQPPAAPAQTPPSTPPAATSPGQTPPATRPAATPPAVAAPGQPTPPAGPYRPEGLPETMFGETDHATMDNMAKALKGYRDKDAARVVPDDPTGYGDFSKMEVSDAIKPYLEGLAEDPVFKPMAEWAKAEGKDVGEFQSIVLKAFEVAGGANLLSPMIDEAAEETALVPDDLKTAPADKQREAANARVDAAENALKAMMDSGQLPKDIGEHAALSLLDTAAGVKFIEWAMNGRGGAQPFGGGGGTGQATADAQREALRAELAKPEMQASNPKFDKAKYDELQGRYRALIK